MLATISLLKLRNSIKTIWIVKIGFYEILGTFLKNLTIILKFII